MIFILITTILFCLYIYGTRNFDYWKKRGVRHNKPLPFVGNNLSLFLCWKTETDIHDELYMQFPDEKIVGNFCAQQPQLIIRDPDLIKKLFVADFFSFHSRRLTPDDDFDHAEPLNKNIVYACGDPWKLMRQKLTPFFTTSKLKGMFPIIANRADKLQKWVQDAASTGQEVDASDTMCKYTIDVIADYILGVDVDTQNDDAAFLNSLGKRLFTKSKRDAVCFALKTIIPELFSNLQIFSKDLEHSFTVLITNLMKRRNHQPIGRNDFLDFLLKVQRNGKLQGESMFEKDSDGSPKNVELELDDILLLTQAVAFFAAGFESSSSTISYALHEMAYQPEVQWKCQQEIDEVLKRFDNKLCYEAVLEMKYLEMCILEAIRLFPAVPTLVRKCTENYTIPGTDVIIDKDVTIYVPSLALNLDEKYHEKPHLFIPERFSPDNYNNIKNVYLPFGLGPRACIGQRVGLLQTVAGLAAALQNCSVAPGPNTVRHPINDPWGSITRCTKGGLPLVFSKRKI